MSENSKEQRVESRSNGSGAASNGSGAVTNGNGLTIRPLKLEDLHEVFALGEKLFTAERWPTLYRMWDEYELVEFFASESDTCLVAELEDKVVGFALGTMYEKRHSAWSYGYLAWLGVDPDKARCGVASKLVNRLTDLFIEMGARMVLVDTDPDNSGAISFFKKQGFGHDQPHVYLAKNLTHDPQYRRHRAKRGAHTQRKAPRKPVTAEERPIDDSSDENC